MAKWWKYFVNPLGAIVNNLTKDSKTGSLGAAINGILNPGDTMVQALSSDKYHDIGDITNEGISNAYDYLTNGEGAKAISNVYDDLTGKSQIELQNKLQREMAEEEYQRNLQSIGDTASAYEAAGYNKNLLYSGASPTSYSAPALQAYSGSSKLDSILSRVGKVVNLIPAFYQATAALEGIDQARERTKQNEIRTTAMGMDLIDKAYTITDKANKVPFNLLIPNNSARFRRHLTNSYSNSMGYGYYQTDEPLTTKMINNYLDSSLKYKVDLLNSIGIKNMMNTTLNNWRGYQFDLDRRFGAAGRIVGMASQGIGAAAKAYGSLYSPIKLGGYKR